jgi:Cytochrome P460
MIISHRLLAAVAAVATSLPCGADDQTTKRIRGSAEPALTTPNASSPVFGVTIPAGYRQWTLVAPSHRPDFDELRAVLGNAKSMKAYTSGTLPFPDGSILVKLAWKHVESPEYKAANAAGSGTTLQVMVKDSKKYASTGGWGFGRFVEGRAADEAQHQTCFACHKAFVKDHDFVFTRFAP